MPSWWQLQGSLEAHKAVIGLQSYPDENWDRKSTSFLPLCTVFASLLQSPRHLSFPSFLSFPVLLSGCSLSSKERQGASNPGWVLLKPCWVLRCLPRYVTRCAEAGERLAMQPAPVNRLRTSGQQGALWCHLGSSLAEPPFPWAFVQDRTAVEW